MDVLCAGNFARASAITGNLFRQVGASCTNVAGVGRATPTNNPPAFSGNNFFFATCGTVRAAAGSFTAAVTGNYWGPTTDASVRAVLVDWNDDATLGFLTYAPFLTSPSTGAPPLPPSGVTKATSGTGVRLTWNANTESDLAGYRIFWGSSDGFRFAHSVEVGNVTSYTVPSVLVSERFAVAAFDNARSGSSGADRIAGHESWPTEAP